jgi:hypothetical protein
MDLQLRFIQPTFLSGVLIYDDEKAHLLIVSPLIITSGIVLVKIALKKQRNSLLSK